MKKRVTAWAVPAVAGAVLYLYLGWNLSHFPVVQVHGPALSLVLVGLALAFLWLWGRALWRVPGLPRTPWLLAGALEILALVLGAALAGGLVHWQGQRAWDKALARLRSSGLDAALPAADPALPEGANGRALLEPLASSRALDALSLPGGKAAAGWTEDFNAVARAFKGGPGDPGAFLRLKARRGELKPLLAALDRAQAASGFSWGIDYSVPWFSVQSPPTRHLLVLARVAACEAWMLASEGRRAAAEARVQQALWLAERLGENRTLVGAVASVAAGNAALDGLWPLLARAEGLRTAAALRPGEAQARVEAALALEFLALPRDLAGLGAAEIFRGYLVGRRPTARDLAWRLFYLPWELHEAAAGLENAMVKAACLSRRPATACAACLQNAERNRNAGSWTLLALAAPSLSDLAARGAGATLRERLAKAGAEAWAWRIRNQKVVWKGEGVKRRKTVLRRWPRGLAALQLGEAAKDPLNGRPFEWRQRGAELRIASLGLDGREGTENEREALQRDLGVVLNPSKN